MPQSSSAVQCRHGLLVATIFAWLAVSASPGMGEVILHSPEFAAALDGYLYDSSTEPDFAFATSELRKDEQVLPSQALSPSLSASLNPQSARQRPGARSGVQRAAQSGVSVGLASVPFMIGDSGVGTCFAIRGIVTADLSHPSLTCSRLNISENNTALPIDRFYYSYRHFHNSTGVQAFQYREEFNFDRHTLGLEKTFLDGLGSVEMRLPLEYRLRNDIISLISPPDGVVDVVTGSEDYQADLGNMSFLMKLLLWETRDFALSTGLGVTVPTASDVHYDIGVNDTILFPSAPGVTGETLATFENRYVNEATYLSPFMAWLWAPAARKSRWYHQGFLQVEVAANPSTLITEGGGVTDFFFNGAPIGNVVYRTLNDEPVQSDVFAQTLLRVNLGLGYLLLEPDHRRLVSNLRTLLELHYTTTPQRANTSEIAIEQIGVGAFFPQFGTVGNANPRSDILNLAAGFSLDVGRFTVTNGFISPLREAPDRGFDFEYNLQVQTLY